MATIKQIYINAGTLLRTDFKTYERVRGNIERLVMEEKEYKWDDEATKDFINRIFLVEV